jgi:hypothetical protein
VVVKIGQIAKYSSVAEQAKNYASAPNAMTSLAEN